MVLKGGAGGWDIADGELDDGDATTAWEKGAEAARQVGRELALDTDTRQQVIREVFMDGKPQRAYECGQGIA